jgi:hypothetical protein
MEDLDGAEEEIDRLITKRKLKIDQALLLRNQFERLSASFSEEGPPMLSQKNQQGDSQPRSSMNQGGHQSDWEQNAGWQNEQSGAGGGGPPERNW